MPALQIILGFLLFGFYVFICWFISSPHFIEALYKDITGEDCDVRREAS